MAAHRHGMVRAALVSLALVCAFAPPAMAKDAMSQQLTPDQVAAKAIAAEMEKNAGQQGAVRTAAAHFGDQLESHHYPASPGDGVVPGPVVAKAIGGSLAAYQKVAPDYRMDEKISVRGDVVTITSYTSGTYATGGRFEDVSLVSYQVKDGKIVRADAIHTNPGAIQKAMRGTDDRAIADHASAEAIAAKMKASGGDSIEVATGYFAERIAAWSPANPERSILFPREPLNQQIFKEQKAVKAALTGYANAETVKVEGNRILVDGRADGTGPDGKPTWSDASFVFYVTDGAIVGIQTSHSPGAIANLKKLMGG